MVENFCAISVNDLDKFAELFGEKKGKDLFHILLKTEYRYMYICNCIQYYFGLLGLISAVLKSRLEVKLKKYVVVPKHVPRHVVVPKPLPECSNQRAIFEFQNFLTLSLF